MLTNVGVQGKFKFMVFTTSSNIHKFYILPTVYLFVL
jgi:hypothetical protein